MRSRILVVGRDVAVRARLARLLTSAGYGVEIAENAAHARRIDRKGLALAIVAQDGTADDDAQLVGELTATIGTALRLADPSDEAGLLARVAAALRPAAEADAVDPVLQFAGFRLDPAGRTLTGETAREIPLTRGEFGLLHAFAQRPGRVLSRDQLLNALAGRDAEAYDRSIDMLVVRLRRKIEADPRHPGLIVTVPGSGYKFAAKVREAEAADAAEPDAPAAAPEPVPSAPERRYVTALAAELLPADGARLPADPEELRGLIDAFRRYAGAVVPRHGGSVAESRVREVVAYFGWPVAQEHAAERAIHAGLALAEHLAEGDAALPAGFAVRVGVASGLVIADPAGEVLGETPGEATRLLHLAEPGQVVIAESTRRVGGGQFAYRALVQGDADAWQVLGPTALGSRSEAIHAGGVTPLFGREDELGQLLRAWAQAKLGEGRLVLLSGEPGIGKSRLLAALQEELADEPHLSRRYFCSPLHRDSALHPVIARWEQAAGFARGDSPEARLRKLEAVLAVANAAPEDVALIAAMLSVPTAGRYPQRELSPQRRKELTFAVLHRLLLSAAGEQPVLLLFEDAHWADPSSLELLDGLLERLTGLPILLVVSYRPEFVAPWVGRAGTTLIALGRLNRRQSTLLAAEVIAERTVSPGMLDRIAAQTDGVPLFIEELTKAILESAGDAPGRLPPAVPATLHASLMARLDRLPAAKQVAQVGAVIGREFSHALLAAAADLPEARIAQGLDELVAAGLATRRGMAQDRVYAFKHALVQDATYESLLKTRRQALHARITEVIETQFPELPEQQPELLAQHAAGAGLTAKAADYYRRAGARAAARAASAETKAYLERGLRFAATLPDGQERSLLEASLLIVLGDTMQMTKGFANREADDLFARAVPLCRLLGDPKMLFRALEARFTFFAMSGDMRAAYAIAQQFVDAAAAHYDPAVVVVSQVGMGCALFWQGRLDVARQHLDAAVALTPENPESMRPDSRIDVYGQANLAPVLACLGYPEQSLRRVDAAIEWAGRRGSFALAYGISVAGRALVVLHEVARLRRAVMMQVTLCEEHGYLQLLAGAHCVLGWIDAREGRVDRGLALLRGGLAGLGDLGMAFSLPFHLGMEADALLHAEQRSAAMAALEQGLDVAEHTGETWFVAELHRMRGELFLIGPAPDPRAAEQALRQAIRIARAQSARLFELRAAMSLARLWAAQGRHGDAKNLLAPVHAWFAEGFDTVDLREAKALLDSLSG